MITRENTKTQFDGFAVAGSMHILEVPSIKIKPCDRRSNDESYYYFEEAGKMFLYLPSWEQRTIDWAIDGIEMKISTPFCKAKIVILNSIADDRTPHKYRDRDMVWTKNEIVIEAKAVKAVGSSCKGAYTATGETSRTDWAVFTADTACVFGGQYSKDSGLVSNERYGDRTWSNIVMVPKGSKFAMVSLPGSPYYAKTCHIKMLSQHAS